MSVPGERGGELLPLLLKPGTLTKMSKAERAALRQRTGLDSFADMARFSVAAAGSAEGLTGSLVGGKAAWAWEKEDRRRGRAGSDG